MKTYGVAQAFQQTRHARRIYIGGIPPNYINEDDLRDFLNEVISKGLNEDNDSSYVLSIYINQKKCFAFVELKSIELTTACLELDGLIFKKIILKVLRANEYKPELIPPAMLGKPIRLDLSSFSFGNPSASSYPSQGMPSAGISSDVMEQSELRLDSLIQLSNLMVIERDSIAIVGFPYDGTSNTPSSESRKSSSRGLGSVAAPKCLRNSIRKHKYGSVHNPEYQVDISAVKFFDVGDVLAGKNHEETRMNLSATIVEIVSRGAILFVVGGSNEESFSAISGLMSVAGGSIGVICISAVLDTRLLEDVRFCPPRNGLTSMPSCEGRYIHFGAQGSQCTKESAQCIDDRDGKILWLSKDLHNSSQLSNTVQQFKSSLTSVGTNVSNGSSRPIAISLDCGAIASAVNPFSVSNSCPAGLTIAEVLEIAMVAGANSNVALFEVCEFNPESDDSRNNLLLAEIFYKFSLGVATRPNYSKENRNPKSPSLSISDISFTNNGLFSPGNSGLVSNNKNGFLSSLGSSSGTIQQGSRGNISMYSQHDGFIGSTSLLHSNSISHNDDDPLLGLSEHSVILSGTSLDSGDSTNSGYSSVFNSNRINQFPQRQYSDFNDSMGLNKSINNRPALTSTSLLTTQPSLTSNNIINNNNNNNKPPTTTSRLNANSSSFTSHSSMSTLSMARANSEDFDNLSTQQISQPRIARSVSTDVASLTSTGSNNSRFTSYRPQQNNINANFTIPNYNSNNNSAVKAEDNGSLADLTSRSSLHDFDENMDMSIFGTGSLNSLNSSNSPTTPQGLSYNLRGLQQQQMNGSHFLSSSDTFSSLSALRNSSTQVQPALQTSSSNGYYNKSLISSPSPTSYTQQQPPQQILTDTSLSFQPQHNGLDSLSLDNSLSDLNSSSSNNLGSFSNTGDKFPSWTPNSMFSE
eukprot:gene8410-11373_t